MALGLNNQILWSAGSTCWLAACVSPRCTTPNGRRDTRLLLCSCCVVLLYRLRSEDVEGSLVNTEVKRQLSKGTEVVSDDPLQALLRHWWNRDEDRCHCFFAAVCLATGYGKNVVRQTRLFQDISGRKEEVPWPKFSPTLAKIKFVCFGNYLLSPDIGDVS